MQRLLIVECTSPCGCRVSDASVLTVKQNDLLHARQHRLPSRRILSFDLAQISQVRSRVIRGYEPFPKPEENWHSTDRVYEGSDARNRYSNLVARLQSEGVGRHNAGSGKQKTAASE